MKEKNIFVNPFRIISPKLDTEASRLEEIHEAPPGEVTRLEEGLLVMTSKLIEMTTLMYKSFIIADPESLKNANSWGEKSMMRKKVSRPTSSIILHQPLTSSKPSYFSPDALNERATSWKAY